MSSDAKAWTDDEGYTWSGVHDGKCDPHAPRHADVPLTELLMDMEWCVGTSDSWNALRWFIRTYPDGKTGLVGYRT